MINQTRRTTHWLWLVITLKKSQVKVGPESIPVWETDDSSSGFFLLALAFSFQQQQLFFFFLVQKHKKTCITAKNLPIIIYIGQNFSQINFKCMI